MKGVTDCFDERQIGGGQLTEGRIRNMIRTALEEPMKLLGEQTQGLTTSKPTNRTEESVTPLEDDPPEQQQSLMEAMARRLLLLLLRLDIALPCPWQT